MWRGRGCCTEDASHADGVLCVSPCKPCTAGAGWSSAVHSCVRRAYDAAAHAAPVAAAACRRYGDCLHTQQPRRETWYAQVHRVAHRLTQLRPRAFEIDQWLGGHTSDGVPVNPKEADAPDARFSPLTRSLFEDEAEAWR